MLTFVNLQCEVVNIDLCQYFVFQCQVLMLTIVNKVNSFYSVKSISISGKRGCSANGALTSMLRGFAIT